MDLIMLLHAFYLLIELLAANENVLYMSFNTIKGTKEVNTW